MSASVSFPALSNISSQSSSSSSNSSNTDYLTSIINPWIAELGDQLHALRGKISITEFRRQASANGEEIVACLRVDFSNHPALQGDPSKGLLNRNNNQVGFLINKAFLFLNERTRALNPPVSCIITEVDLSRNTISGRSLLQHYREGLRAFQEVPQSIIARSKPNEWLNYLYDDILETIEYVNFNHTCITSEGLKNLNALQNLKELSCDYCSGASNFIEVETSKCPKVKRISLIGTAICNTQDALTLLEQKFPAIECIDLTQQKSEKAVWKKFLGLTDPSTLQSTIYPHALIPCGHIVNRMLSLDAVQKHRCPLGCEDVFEAAPAQIFHSRFQKEEDRWTVELLDFAKKPLSSRTFIHIVCQQAFNYDTLVPIIETASAVLPNEISSDKTIINICNKIDCPGCTEQGMRRFLNLVRIFPTITEKDDQFADSQQQETLEKTFRYANT